MSCKSVLFGISFFLLCVASNPAQNPKVESQIRTLLLDSRTFDPEKLANVLAESYVETRTSGAGTTKLKRAEILQEFAKHEGRISELYSSVKLDDEISGLVLSRFGSAVGFRYDVVERSTIEIDGETKQRITKVERYKVNGVAIQRGNKWELSSLHKSFLLAKDNPHWREDLDSAFAFDMALLSMVMSGMDKDREKVKTKPEPR